MEIVTVHVARTTLSKLLLRAETGEEITIARGNKPVAKLVPIAPHQGKRRFGALKGLLNVGPEFFEPLPEQELGGWGN